MRHNGRIIVLNPSDAIEEAIEDLNRESGRSRQCDQAEHQECGGGYAFEPYEPGVSKVYPCKCPCGHPHLAVQS